LRTRLVALLAVAVLAAWAASVVLGGDDGRRDSPLGAPSRPVPRTEPSPAPAKRPPDRFGRIDDPFAYDPSEADEFEANAAQGVQHPIYAQVPGGAVVTARRVAAWRPLVEQVAGRTGFDADTLEAMVYLESAGFPDARAGSTEDAVGLTQILAETGQNLLGMRVDVGESARLTQRLRRATRRGQTRRVRELQARRRRVDERYDPRKALAATGRYLTIAREEFGRDDLAVVSYHMGIGNLQSVRERFGADDETPYAEIYFDSSPLRHPAAWSLLASFGDDSSTYYWRVLAARDVMRRFRSDEAALAARAAIVTAKNSTEELLQPVASTPVFDTPEEVERAYEDGTIVALPARDLAGAGVRIHPDMGELARRVRQTRTLYRGLRPEALALLVYLARATEAIGGDQPLTITSTVRDRRYQSELLRRNIQATAGYSLHTTGYAFDVLRDYRSRRQALAFQFVLDRLAALDVIAWVREPAAIHITVGPRATALLPLLDR
jgi:soluble lytic murein transglycosylase-like protein